MRKLLVFIIVLFFTNAFVYGEEVVVTLPDFEVILGQEELLSEHSQYPVFVYKNMTYFPLTSDYISGLGLDLEFDSSEGLKLSKTIPNLFEQRFLGHYNHLNEFQVEVVPFKVEIQGEPVNNQLEKYPFLLYKNITYFPMTWAYAHDKLGLSYLYTNEEGLVINGEIKSTLSPSRLIMTVGEDESSRGLTYNLSLSSDTILHLYNEDLTLIESFKGKSNGIIKLGQDEYVYNHDITNLVSDSKYYYRIEQADNISKLYGFETMSLETKMAFFGDIQGYKLDQYINFYNVYDKAHDNHKIDLTYIAGDIVDTGDSILEWSYLDKAMLNRWSNNMLVTSIGNHDVKNSSDIYEKTFSYPKNGVKGLDNRNFYFDLPNARVAVWDTESFDHYDQQKAWLIDVMAHTHKFKIVLMHRSAYPILYDEPFVRRLSETFEVADIDLVLSGHDHIYSRTSMFQHKKVPVNDGVTYVIGGSGSGSKYYNGQGTRSWANVVYDENKPVYSILEIKNDMILFEAYAIINDDVKLIDEFIIDKE